jgi:hypothetical protein
MNHPKKRNAGYLNDTYIAVNWGEYKFGASPEKICLEKILTAAGWPLAVKYMDVFHNLTSRSERSIVSGLILISANAYCANDKRAKNIQTE